MKRLRLRTTVLGGAAIGLIAGAAVFGAVSSTSAVAYTPVAYKPTAAQVALAKKPPPAAPCAAGQTLEKGVCVIHVRKVVVDPAPAVVQAKAPARSANRGSGSYSSGKRAEAVRDYEQEDDYEQEGESESEGEDDD